MKIEFDSEKDGEKQHCLIDYKQLSVQKIEDYLINQHRLKYGKYTYTYKHDFPIGYTIPVFFSRCAERFSETQAEILSNLFFYCRAKFNVFHFSYKDSGILYCDILVSNKIVKAVHEAFDLIFKYRENGEKHLRIIPLSKGSVFEMDIASFYHYLDPNMFIYKTKLLSDDDFVKGKEKHQTIGKWLPERIDDPELNPMHPDAVLWSRT